MVQNKINVVFSMTWNSRKCGQIRNNEIKFFTHFAVVEKLYTLLLMLILS